jgi:hypothetical protein
VVLALTTDLQGKGKGKGKRAVGAVRSAAEEGLERQAAVRRLRTGGSFRAGVRGEESPHRHGRCGSSPRWGVGRIGPSWAMVRCGIPRSPAGARRLEQRARPRHSRGHAQGAWDGWVRPGVAIVDLSSPGLRGAVGGAQRLPSGGGRRGAASADAAASAGHLPVRRGVEEV